MPVKNDNQIQRLVGSSQICVQPAFVDIVGKMYYRYYESYDVNCDVKCITFMQNSVLSADRTPDEHEHCCWTPGYADGRESMLCKAHDHVPIWQSQTVK